MAQRPANTYVSQVFNFGVDKNIPLGFVNVVFNKNYMGSCIELIISISDNVSLSLLSGTLKKQVNTYA
jgi:hypothetical protein